MGLDHDPARYPGVTALSLPRASLGPILRAWGGDGDVYASLAAIEPEPGEMAWVSSDVRRRARRVLLGLIEPSLKALPTSLEEWEQYLPVVQFAVRNLAFVPSGSTDWSETVREFGWPPTMYHVRERHREVDDVALSALAWLALRLDQIVLDVKPIAPGLVEEVGPAVHALLQVAATRLSDTTPSRPDRLDLRSLATSGFPWHTVADVAGQVGRAETDLAFLAFELIQPDPSAEARLFHLAILGEVIRSFEALGFRVHWRAPLQALTRSGPQIVVARGADTWDLWYEAAGARGFYGLPPSAYRAAVEHIMGAGGAIGSDVAVVGRDSRSLLLEIKWSANPTYVGRSGFHQAMSYAFDARHGITPEVWSFVVGPQEVVHATSISTTAWEDESIVVGSMSVDGVRSIVEAFIDGDPNTIPTGL